MNATTSQGGGTLLALSNDLAAAVERAGRSVVAVNARQRIASSGVHWRPGVVVSAAHSIQREEEITLTLPDGKSVPATLAGLDPGTDLAVLKAEGLGIPVAEIGAADSLKVGHLVLALGRDEDGDAGASFGAVSALGSSWRSWKGGRIDQLVRLDLALYPGFSGGPLVDGAGRVLGINTSGLSRSAPLAIPAATVERIAGQLLSLGRVARGFLGLAMQPVRLPAEMRRALAVKSEAGLIILGVEPDGPAARAGFLVGDVLVKLGDTEVSDTADVQAVLGPESVGTELRASLVRAGNAQQLNVTVGESPRSQR